MQPFASTVFQAGLITLAAAFCAAASAGTLATSSFDAGTEGWLAINGATPLQAQASEGESGGYVRASDLATGALWFFTAPTSYTGDQSAAYGAELSFYLRSESVSTPLGGSFAQVQLLGNNGVLLAWSSGIDPGTRWTPYSVSFDTSAGWSVGSLAGALASEAEIRSVLGDMKALRIRGDYGQAVDTTGLDSVVLTAVPEPGAAWLMLLGLSGVAVVRRKASHGLPA